MKVYCVFKHYSDECTWDADYLHKIFASQADAETEVTRVELRHLELKEKFERGRNWQTDWKEIFTPEERREFEDDSHFIQAKWEERELE